MLYIATKLYYVLSIIAARPKLKIKCGHLSILTIIDQSKFLVLGQCDSHCSQYKCAYSAQ